MKLRTIALIALLTLSLTACSRQNNGSTSKTETEEPSPSQSTSEAATEDPPPRKDTGEEENELPVFTAADDHIEVRVELDKPQYDKNSVISATVTVTNLTDSNIVYVQGSSASVIPDALKYHLDGLSAMFYPEFVTMDYGVQVLEPGLTLQYLLDFAPYISKEGVTAFGVDKELDFFQTEDFTPATPGIIKGAAAFTYVLLPEGSDAGTAMSALEESPSQVLELELFTTIVE